MRSTNMLQDIRSVTLVPWPPALWAAMGYPHDLDVGSVESYRGRHVAEPADCSPH